MTQEVGAVSTPFPVRLTSFVGRVAELRAVRDALNRQRLVTLAGPGGAGKTRLALEAAKASVAGQRWYVDLAPLEGEAPVGAALAVATGAPEGPGEDPLHATVRRVGDTPTLVLVDNCDQVLADCAQAVDALLRSCPGLTVLATSREPLRVEGEFVVRVPPLSLPSDDDDMDGDAVLLFLDRAQLAPENSLRDRASIRELCRRLDGMPLAIELAAARAAALSVSDILAGLTDRFSLLADGPRTADRRQRSLAASIHWSYRLLSESETLAVQRLAVFRSPFTADAATAVVAGEGIDGPDVLPLLARLVEKSFVVIDERGDVSRYRLLETIREYAAERLEEAPSDAAATHDRHLRFLRDVAERMEPILRRQPPLQWVDRFESELPDIRAAVSWAAKTGNADDAFRLTGSLSRFWWVRARADGRRILDAALAIDGGDPRWRAHALTAATIAALARYDPTALDLGREAVRWAVDCEDSAVEARAYCWLGWTDLYMDLAQAQSPLTRARGLARDADDPWTEATALNGLVGTELGRSLPSAKAMADEALAVASSQDNRVEICSARLWLATIALAQGRLAEVEAQAHRALPVAESMGDVLYTAYWHAFLAQSAVMRSDEEAAGGHAEILAAMAEASANPVLLGYAAAVKAIISHTREGTREARVLLKQALPAVAFFPSGMYAAWMSDILTDAAIEASQPDEARAHAVTARQFAEAADNGWARSQAQLASARVNVYAGEVQAARQDVHLALDHAALDDDVMTTIEALELLARLERELRSPETAVRLAAAAAAARTGSGYVCPLVGKAGTDALLDELRNDLGGRSFDDVWAEGHDFTLDQAVALARRGRGRRGRPASGWDALTPAERRVVALVGEGLTNPQIAARLFVSPDTVKGHVSAAFRKLGVANRAELAAEAARRGAAGARSADPDR